VITAPNANTLDIDLNAPRTVINWASLHVSGADSMIFHFDANSDIVLNKTTSQIAIDAGGTVSGLVGAATGGNIWFYSPQGVIVSPGAVMTAGGFLFSRGSGISRRRLRRLRRPAGDPARGVRRADPDDDDHLGDQRLDQRQRRRRAQRGERNPRRLHRGRRHGGRVHHLGLDHRRRSHRHQRLGHGPPAARARPSPRSPPRPA
jgi:filamentous hemagglutinin family protein